MGNYESLKNKQAEFTCGGNYYCCADCLSANAGSRDRVLV